MPMEAAGRAAVDLLLDGLDAGDEAEVTHRWLPTQLIVRSTTAPPRQGSGSAHVMAGR
jgi:LacI family transcriptional regulator/LacI family repressor for deo operon, udp, cdd, tsx, nupC, and nupG